MPGLARRVRRAAGGGGATGAQAIAEQTALLRDVAGAGARLKSKTDRAAHQIDRGRDKARDLGKRARTAGAAIGMKGLGEKIGHALDVAVADAGAVGDGVRIAGAAAQGATAGAAGGIGAEGSRQSFRDFAASSQGIAMILGGSFAAILLAGRGRGGVR